MPAFADDHQPGSAETCNRTNSVVSSLMKLVADMSLVAHTLPQGRGVDRGGNDVLKTARLLAPERMTAADVKEIVRYVLLQCGVPFTDIVVTSNSSTWKVIVHDQNGLIFRLPIH